MDSGFAIERKKFPPMEVNNFVGLTKIPPLIHRVTEFFTFVFSLVSVVRRFSPWEGSLNRTLM